MCDLSQFKTDDCIFVITTIVRMQLQYNTKFSEIKENFFKIKNKL